MNPKSPPSILRGERANELPFFIFVSLILSGIAAWSIYATAALHAPARYIPFIALMVLHIGMYWASFLLEIKPSIILPYLAFQGLLAFVLNLIGQNMGLAMGLYFGLIGIAVGMLGLTRRAALVVGFYLILSLINYGNSAGWSKVPFWLAVAIPTMLFVIIYVTLYNRQTEARARSQALAAELEAANRQLSEYAARVEELTLTNERQRMARELHDTLSQGLAGLILQLEAVDAHLASSRTEKARAITQQVMAQARVTLADARRAIDDLRLNNPGDLAESARQEVDRFTQATGIQCQLEMNLNAPIPDELCESARRAITEAVSNIARHAQASHVQVSLTSTGSWLDILIRDDGVGFDPQAVEAASGHYGILGMRERARLVGGTLEIDSHPGSGTVIHLRFPVSPAAVSEPVADNAQETA